MVANMIKKLVSSIKLVVQVLKNLILRPFRMIRNKTSHAMNAGRLVTKFPGVVKKLPKILKKKPEKREDYFDWGTIYVAKSLVLVVSILLIVIPLLIIFLIAPLCVRWWGVKDFHHEDPDLSGYTGRVCVYYDKEETLLKFEGRLDDGNAVKYGEEYHPNGRVAYVGEYEGGRYSGEGILYSEDGTMLYRGEFLDGRYEGPGELYGENGEIYQGIFAKGKLNGAGTLTQDGVLWYAGNFENGQMSGEGKIYHPNGAEQYKGTFSAGALEGVGMEYYESGVLKYYGDFLNGQYHGNGTAYSNAGVKLYSGGFEKGEYAGDGTLYVDGDLSIVGSFDRGELIGVATLVYPNGLTYEGTFDGSLPHGSGVLTDLLGTFTYTGRFLDGDLDLPSLLLTETSEANGYFADGLTIRAEEDCFYLCHSGYGLFLQCRFAGGDSAPIVTEAACRPLAAGDVTISAVTDLHIAHADRVYAPDLDLPAWMADVYGIPADSVDCYAAIYNENTAVYYWVDRDTKVLLLKSASVPEGLLPPVTEDPSAADAEARREIEDIFAEFGLDLEDFGSLGFGS